MKYPFAFTFVFEYYTYYDFSRGNKHPATASIQPGNFLRLAKRTDSRSSRRGGVILYVIGGRVGLVWFVCLGTCYWSPIHTHSHTERKREPRSDRLALQNRQQGEKNSPLAAQKPATIAEVKSTRC